MTGALSPLSPLSTLAHPPAYGACLFWHQAFYYVIFMRVFFCKKILREQNVGGGYERLCYKYRWLFASLLLLQCICPVTRAITVIVFALPRYADTETDKE